MKNFIEGSPLQTGENYLKTNSENIRAVHLEGQFPKATVIIPAGSTLYHQSRWVNALLQRNRFDYRLASDGAFFFTDVQVPNRTNCRIEIPFDLILYSRDELDSQQWNSLVSLGNGNQWDGAMQLGFDGFVVFGRDAFVILDDERSASEICLFSRTLPKLGNIAHITGQYPSRYRDLKK